MADDMLQRVEKVANGGTINGTYGALPMAALEAFKADLHTIIARARAGTEAAEEAGHEAYSEGFRNGFVDAHITDETGWPDDDGAAWLRKLDNTSMADGWQNHRDTFLKALDQPPG